MREKDMIALRKLIQEMRYADSRMVGVYWAAKLEKLVNSLEDEQCQNNRNQQGNTEKIAKKDPSTE
jgi:hypothetical protein